jgi:polysaccharide chain length determinant protein (PEP-CTERM system associated)
MLSKGTVSVSEVKRLLRRYWWILPIAGFTMAAIGFTAAQMLPKKYTSSTMVLVQPPAVDVKVLPTTAQEDLYRDLASMQQQILSRTRLQPIIEKFNVFPKRKPTDHMDVLVEELKKDIEVELMQPMAGSQDKQPPGFHVSVTLGDPVVAQQVCTEITSMFMEQNATGQVKKSVVTNEFLTQELNEAQANLNEQDKKLADFKRMHAGDLPEQEQGILSMLATLKSQLEANTQAISRAQQDKTFNETLLNQQEASWKAAQSGGVSDSDSLDKQLATLQDQLSELMGKYTPEHPDVVKTKAQIETLKRRIAAASTASDAQPSAKSSASIHEPAPIQQMRARIKQDDQSIADLTRQQASIQRDIAAEQGHLQASPMAEQEMKELTRNYQTALDQYNDLLKNQQKSAMLESLQNQQEGQTFKVLDPPGIPMTPSFPNKTLFVGGGFGAGLALGAGILYLLAMADKAMYTEADVELCLKLPVLTLVPSFDVTEYSPKLQPKPSKEMNVLATKA